LSSVKAKRQLSRLKDDVKRNPSPTTVGALAQYFIQIGDNDAAYGLVEKGLKQYQDSEILKRIWSYVRKSKVDDKSRDAIKALDEKPTPEGFVTVIRSFRDVDDIESAAKFARRFAKQFPDIPDAHRLRGEIRLTRFAQDFSAKDGREAEEALKKTIELNPDETAARFMLARLYYYCGLTKRAGVLADEVLERKGDHKKALKMKKLLETLELQDEDPDMRFSQIEERKAFYQDWGAGDSDPEANGSSVTPEQVEAVGSCLDAALEIAGVESATFIARDGSRWGTGNSSGEIGWEPFCDFVGRIGTVACTASLRMDIGSFEKGIIETPQGGAVIRELRDGTVAFLLEDSRNILKIYPDLRDLVEKLAADCG
jgi:tetratricopeptide (TPR) repeat protein